MKKLDHFIKNYFCLLDAKARPFYKKNIFFENAPFGFLFNVFYPVFQKRIQTHDFLVSALTTILVFHNQCSPDQNCDSETFKQLPLKKFILFTLKTLATIIVLFVDYSVISNF
jgi:hypothetical protein